MLIFLSFYCFSGLSDTEISQAEENHNKLLASVNCVGTTLAYRCDNNCHTRVVMIRNKVEETNFIEVCIVLYIWLTRDVREV